MPPPNPEDDMLPWSADSAMREMWSEMDRNVTNGQMQAFLMKHLQLAYDAGRREQRQETAKATKQITDALEAMRAAHS